MRARELAALDANLTRFLEDLVGSMGRSERRRWAKVYVSGLLLDGDRKSIEPMAARLEGAEVQALRQFVGQSPWAVETVQRALAHWVIEAMSEPEVWMIDETSFPKAGEHSVGVARQYCGALGKLANCQVGVSLHWSTTEMSCPISWRLYLPKAWIEDPERCAQARVPEATPYRSKRELALELLDQAVEWQLPRLPVVADADYGSDFDFRSALRERGFPYAVAVAKTTKVWLKEPQRAPMPPPRAGRGRRQRNAPWEQNLPEALDLPAMARQLPPSAWKEVTWRQGTKAPMRSRFACVQVWASHGWQTLAPLPHAAEWLLIEWPNGAEVPTDYWLADLGPKAPGLRRLIRTARARWRIELDYRELKEELGLDHYEGRHWLGWHHHVTLVSMAFAFLRSEQLRSKKNFWCDPASDSAATAGAADPSGGPLPMVPDPLS
jgi:SRSO17 transposase